MSYNKCIFIGNITRDAELRYTPQGTAVASFNIAVNDKYKSNGEMKTDVLFLECVMFGKRAESVSPYLLKGTQVLVDGKLKEEKWEKNGEKKSKMKLMLNDVQLLGGKKQAASGDEAPPECETDVDPF